MLKLEKILERYAPVKGSDEFKQFTNFYKNENLNYLSKWIEENIAEKHVKKSNEVSDVLRDLGNTSFMEKELATSIEYYSDSLMFAEYNGVEYGKALANRSAASHELEGYMDCLGDINLCLKSAYPRSMRPKVYVRMADCCYRLGLSDQFDEAVRLIEQTGKAEFIDKIKKIKDSPKIKYKRLKVVLPVVNNDTFLSASSKVELKYNDQLGRHVVAKEDVKVGDVLFVEKAFTFALVFNPEGRIDINNCYQCITNTSCWVPCKTCTTCKYCSEDCRDKSWENEHRFECRGMMLWHYLGMSFAAFKCMFKGIQTRFSQAPVDVKDCTKQFGNANDNYSYIDSLVSNISKIDNITPMIASSAVIVLYLKKKTNFFEWLSKLPNMNFHGYHAIHYVGGLLVKHLAQMSCNSGLIMHYRWLYDINEKAVVNPDFEVVKDFLLTDESEPIACALYPSVSMMNHSCKPNINMYYIDDTVVVKAIEPIAVGQEIWNCYGIDYWTTKKPERDLSMQSQYYFTCKCRICIDPTKEYDYTFNYKVCTKCRVRMDVLEEKFVCPRCGHIYFVKEYVKNLNEFKDVLLTTNIRKAETALRKSETVFDKYHDVIYTFYEQLIDLYLVKGNERKFEQYKTKLLEFLYHTYGPNTRRFAVKADSYQCQNVKIRGSNYDIYKLLTLHFPLEDIQVVKQ